MARRLKITLTFEEEGKDNCNPGDAIKIALLNFTMIGGGSLNIDVKPDGTRIVTMSGVTEGLEACEIEKPQKEEPNIKVKADVGSYILGDDGHNPDTDSELMPSPKRKIKRVRKSNDYKAQEDFGVCKDSTLNELLDASSISCPPQFMQSLGQCETSFLKKACGCEWKDNDCSGEGFSRFAAVHAQIGEKLEGTGNKFHYLTIPTRSVRIGSYEVLRAETKSFFTVQFTELGLRFTLPVANCPWKSVMVCIPIDSILSMWTCFHKLLNVVFITTRADHATWIRNVLGLDGNSQDEKSNYYCPMNGLMCQQKIVIVLDNLCVLKTDILAIKKMYASVLTELEYTKANEWLMITSQK